MAAQTTHFFKAKPRPGARSIMAPRRLRRSALRLAPPNAGFSPITAQSSTVAAHHERGELDGAEEVNGG